MIRLGGTVDYDDGREEEYEAGAAILAEWELYALRHGYPIGDGSAPMLSALFLAYAALDVAEGFDVWRKSRRRRRARDARSRPSYPAGSVLRRP